MPGKRKEESNELPDFITDEPMDEHDDELGDDMLDEDESGKYAGKESSGNKAKWVDPTHEELSGYRQAEQLFKSSLLQLQITELRGEVNVEYSKLSGLEEVNQMYLHCVGFSRSL
jgi:hypothetical protein